MPWARRLENLFQVMAMVGIEEAAGSVYGAGETRGNVARALAIAGRFADAREYAQGVDCAD